VRVEAEERRVHALMQVGRAMASAADYEQALAALIRTISELLNVESAGFMLYDPERSELVLQQPAFGFDDPERIAAYHVPLRDGGNAVKVFLSGRPYLTNDAAGDPRLIRRFVDLFDARTSLTVPLIVEDQAIGVCHAINKRGGPFTDEDEARLKAFTAQVSIALENAKLFDDVQNVKNYNESMLQSMSNGVVTLNEEGRIVTCNVAGLRILRVTLENIRNKPAAEFFTGPNAWILEKIKAVEETLKSEITMDAQLSLDKDKVSVNLTVLPLMTVEDSSQKKKLGSLLMIAGSKDHVSPPSVVDMNYKLYKKSRAITDYKEFPNRSHFILGEAGWEEVADYALDWSNQHVAVAPRV